MAETDAVPCPFKPGTPEAFFWAHAPSSYLPPKETPAAGRARSSIELAAAERWGSDAGLSFEWRVDPDCDSRVHSDDPEPWALWECVVRDANGEIVESMGAVDFGRDGEPWGDPYRRVVEAELAAEAKAEAQDAPAMPGD